MPLAASGVGREGAESALASVITGTQGPTPLQVHQTPAQIAAFSRPQPNSVHLYGLTKSVLEQDHEKLGELHMRLNRLLSIPAQKMRAKAAKKGGASKTRPTGKLTWTTPTLLLYFLQNTIENCTPEPTYNAAGLP